MFKINVLVGLLFVEMVCWTISADAISEVDTTSYATYTIFKDGETICAKNRKTGAIEHRGEDATTVIQSALNALDGAGGSIFIRRAETGYKINKSIVIPSNVVVDGDLAILSANWADDYYPSPPLPNRFPPIFYNKNYSVSAYGKDKNITIKNLILQGKGGGKAGDINGSIPIRFAGCDDFHIEKVIIDNETLRTGATNENWGMAQAAIAIDRSNRRTKINNFIIRGGWAGVYLNTLNEPIPPGLPTIDIGANLDTVVSNFIIELAGISNPFTPGYNIGLEITNGKIKHNTDYAFDFERVNNVKVSNVVVECSGSHTGSTFMFGQSAEVDNIDINNVIVSNVKYVCELEPYTGRVHFNNLIVAENVDTVITVVSSPSGIVSFENCNFTGAKRVMDREAVRVQFKGCFGIDDTSP